MRHSIDKGHFLRGQQTYSEDKAGRVSHLKAKYLSAVKGVGGGLRKKNYFFLFKDISKFGLYGSKNFLRNRESKLRCRDMTRRSRDVFRDFSRFPSKYIGIFGF